MKEINQEKQQLWSGNYIRLVLITLLAFTVRQMLTSTFPNFIVSLGGNYTLAGAITLVLTGASITMRLFSGILCDRLGRRGMMVIGSGMFALSLLAMAIAPVLGVITVMQALYGMGMANLTTASGAAVVDIVPSTRLGEGLGYYTLGNSIAMAIGPALGLMLIKWSGYQSVYFVGFFAILICIFLGFGVRYQEVKGVERSFSWGEVLEKKSIPAAFVQFLAVFSFTSVISYIASYAQMQGIESIGLFFTIYAIGMIIVRLFIGKLIDRFNEYGIVGLALLLMVFSFVKIATATDLNQLLCYSLILGFGQGIVMPAVQKAALKTVSPQRRGAATSTYQLFADIGTGIGATVWGIVAEKMGFSSIYYGAAITCGVGIVCCVLFFKRGKVNETMV